MLLQMMQKSLRTIRFHLPFQQSTGFLSALENQDVPTALPPQTLLQKEGIIPALESTHAFVQAFKDAPTMSQDDIILINQSGRGDKDIFTIADAFQDKKWQQFIIEKARKYKSD